MLSAFATAVLGYGLIVLLVYFVQDRLIYFPLHKLETTPDKHGFAYEDVWLTTEDGVRVHGWFIPAPAARATVLHFHGNGGNISHRIERIGLFRRLGLNVFLVDYRGYGRSEGTPSEAGTYRDARAAWRYLTHTRGLAPTAIILHGESLGGGVASWLAAEETPRALIIESSFTSAAQLGAEVYPWLPVKWLARHPYPTIEHIARVRAPMLIIHSRDDEIIPFHHGERLYAAAREPKQFLEIRGGHNDGFIVTGSRYLMGLEAFLRAVLARDATPMQTGLALYVDAEMRTTNS